jgi:shikimate dehydrogenase
MVYAEVIGDPVAQSKSPFIHNRWLSQLGLSGEYRRTRVPAGELAEYFRNRRSDTAWRGCNVTIPHKLQVIAHLDDLDRVAADIGAVNCVAQKEGKLVGYNTDVEGIAAALDSVALEGAKSAIIGGGGAARAAVAYLAGRGVAHIAIVVRDPDKAETLRAIVPGASVESGPFSSAERLFDGAAVIVNASPLGMAGCPQMPADLLSAAASHARRATLFDMVYDPVETAFLSVADDCGGRTIGGLTMLVGQAVRAFELFFGKRPPVAKDGLGDLLSEDPAVRPGPRHGARDER